MTRAQTQTISLLTPALFNTLCSRTRRRQDVLCRICCRSGLLDEKEIASVLKELNAYERTPSLTASQLYRNLKLAYGYNYVDKNLEITHDYDSQGGHGSHVAGIAAANRYLPGENGAYVPARDTVHVSGVARMPS